MNGISFKKDKPINFFREEFYYVIPSVSAHQPNCRIIPVWIMGFEKRFNHALKIQGKEGFVKHMTEDVPPQPENFIEMRRDNQGK